MNKEKFRKHCEEQIERCIKLHDSKHLKEHELSLALLNECEQRKHSQENLIKYLEGLLTGNKTTDMFIVTGVQDLLERIKSNNYEN